MKKHTHRVVNHRVTEESSIRRLRVVKYRGSAHGTNEYPFLIDENGFFVFLVTYKSKKKRMRVKKSPEVTEYQTFGMIYYASVYFE